MNVNSLLYHFRECLSSNEPARLYIIRHFLKKYPFFSFKFRLAIDGHMYPPYAYGMYCAALQAKALGLTAMSTIEFGVAAGHGLLEMELYAEQIFDEIGVNVHVIGFDSGVGLPRSDDYRDQLYFWGEGDFKQDQNALDKKLTKSKVIYGEVEETVISFLEKKVYPPIGFISFDLDFFSSTKSALKIFNGYDEFFLPRVECYFDDVGSSELLCASKETGVLKAISDFNELTDNKILQKMGLQGSRRNPAAWNNHMYVQHRFSHVNYNTRVTNKSGFQTRLTQ